MKTTIRVVSNAAELNRRMVAKRRKVIFRTLGFGLRVIRNHIKTRKTTSRPGGAPHSKGDKRLKKNTRFEADVDNGEGVVGFTRFPSQVATPLGGKTVPDVINEGGRERLDQPPRTILRPDGRPREIAPKPVTADYGPRPITEPHADPINRKMVEIAESTPL